MAQKDIIKRLQNDDQFIDAIDDAIAEIERLRADNEHMEESLTKIRKWIQAYPVDIFPEPDMKQVRRLLEAGGIAIDCVSASNFRWLLNRLYEEVK